MLLPFFQWCETSSLGSAIRDSVWLFPVVEAVHLVALALIGGAVLMVDLRLLGCTLRRESATQVARNAQPWLVGSLTVLLVSGVFLFSSEALKCYYNPPFWAKMTALFLAIVYTFTIRRRVLENTDRFTQGRLQVVAAVSLILWSSVGVAGRFIGFY
jgi:hypothetical protein